MSAKNIVISVSKGEKEFKDVPGVIYYDEGSIYLHYKNKDIAIPVSAILDQFKDVLAGDD